MKKKPNISLLAGSNDFISFSFFEQIITSYDKNKKQIYGINSYKNGENSTLIHIINNNLKFSINKKDMYWFEGDWRSRPKYIAGIFGYNDALYSLHHDYILESTTYDEGKNELALSKLPNVIYFQSKNVYFVNIKTSSPSQITNLSKLINNKKGYLNDESLNEDLKKNFEKEYLSQIKEYII